MSFGLSICCNQSKSYHVRSSIYQPAPSLGLGGKTEFLPFWFKIFCLSCSQVVTHFSSGSHLPRLLASLGMIPVGAPSPLSSSSPLPVVLDGRVIGEVAAERAQELSLQLRTLKALGKEKVCSHQNGLWYITCRSPR